VVKTTESGAKSQTTIYKPWGLRLI
jgi:hypothetical protein